MKGYQNRSLAKRTKNDAKRAKDLLVHGRVGRPKMSEFEGSRDPELTKKELDMQTPLEALQDEEDAARLAGLEVTELDMKEIPNDATIVLAARRRRGKSTFIKQFCFVKRNDYPLVVVFTETKQTGFFESFIPDHLIVQGYDPDVLERILMFQEKRILKAKAEGKGENLGSGGDHSLNILIIFDDIIGNSNIHQCKQIQKVFALGRWFNIGTIVAVQHINVLGPLVRNNADLAVFWNTQSRIVFDLIRENFMGQLTVKEVAAILGQYTKDYRAFCVAAWNPEEKFCHFKSHQRLPMFTMAKAYAKDKEERLTDQPQPTLKQTLKKMLGLRFGESDGENAKLGGILNALVYLPAGLIGAWAFKRTTVKPVTFEQRPRGVPGG